MNSAQASAQAAREILVPFLNDHAAELPFGRLEITQESHTWLARHFDLWAKTDAVGIKGGAIYLVGLRCQQTGRDERTHTVRWPAEWKAYQSALASDSAAATWLVQAYFEHEYRRLLCAYVAPMRDVVTVIEAAWGPDYPTPPLRKAGDGTDDEFAYAYFTALRKRDCGAQRLAPVLKIEQPTLWDAVAT